MPRGVTSRLHRRADLLTELTSLARDEAAAAAARADSAEARAKAADGKLAEARAALAELERERAAFLAEREAEVEAIEAVSPQYWPGMTSRA